MDYLIVAQDGFHNAGNKFRCRWWYLSAVL